MRTGSTSWNTRSKVVVSKSKWLWVEISTVNKISLRCFPCFMNFSITYYFDVCVCRFRLTYLILYLLYIMSTDKMRI